MKREESIDIAAPPEKIWSLLVKRESILAIDPLIKSFDFVGEQHGGVGKMCYMEKRKQYDQFGTVGTAGDMFRSGYTRATFEDLMKDFGGSGLRFDFLDDVFSDFLGGTGFSFKTFGRDFGGRRGMRFETPGGINLEEIFRQAQRPQGRDVRYGITISDEQAAQGLEKILVRKGKNLRVKIPAGVKTGSNVRLGNALQVTDGEPGDIMIMVKVK